ncbi:MAG: tyrosine-protein phosphatase, partial [Lactobacillus crispatus]|nr:tyrosine-protein phosphatase [Lactobacillus crispatus]MCT7699798.1 tyrosine-protein phosphatase [Lactobacillus crispatus]
MKHDRILALDGPLNFRDIGGYQNDKGQHVKPVSYTHLTLPT